MGISITAESSGATLMVRVEGELDLNTAGTFRGEVDGRLLRDRGIRNVLLSLGGLTFVDSSGLGAILGRYRRVSELGGRMAVCNLTPQVRKVFELSGLFKIVTVGEDEEEALRLLGVPLVGRDQAGWPGRTM